MSATTRILGLGLAVALAFSTGLTAWAQQPTPAPSATALSSATPSPTQPAGTPTPTSTRSAPPLTPPPSPTPPPTRAAAPTSTAAAQPSGVELTVYSSGLGLVKEARTFALRQGENALRYAGVPSQIQPATVHIASLTDPQGLTVLEQAFEYDLGDTGSLLRRYVGQPISVTAGSMVYTGTLLSGVQDAILATDDGIRVVRMSQIREISLPNLPGGLVTRPTLSWLLSAASAGEQQMRITYLTGGITWRADYTALLSPDETTLALNGWATLENASGATYENARLKLVAGDIHRVEGGIVGRAPAAGRADEDAGVAERSFADLHLYEVQRPVTVRDQQIKQIEIISAPQVAVRKVYVFESLPGIVPPFGGAFTNPDDGLSGSTRVQVRVEFTNSEESGLGLPLPQGTVRVYREDVAAAEGSAGAELVGEDAIAHTPVDEAVTLRLGDAFDLVGERTQTTFRQVAERMIEESYRITLRNRKPDEDVTIRVIEHLFRARDAQVLEASAEFEMLDANTVQFLVPVPAGAEAQISYSVRYRW